MVPTVVPNDVVLIIFLFYFFPSLSPWFLSLRLNHNPPRRRKNREMKRRGNATERRGEVRRWYWVSLRVCEANLALILILGITQKFMYETVHVRDGLNRRTFSECTEGFSSSCVSEDT
ncbi:hypothetical protein ACSBR2_002402 [Camellia fascicularis]